MLKSIVWVGEIENLIKDLFVIKVRGFEFGFLEFRKNLVVEVCLENFSIELF